MARVLADNPTQDQRKYSATGLSNPMTLLILSHNHQFFLKFPPIRGLTSVKIQGTWHQSNSKITLLPKYTEKQLDNYKTKKACLKTSRIELVQKE